MRRLVCVILASLALLSCSREVSRTPLSKRIVPEHTEIYITYISNGSGGLLPVTNIRMIPTQYIVEYKTLYEDKTTKNRGIRVEEEIYKETEVEEDTMAEDHETLEVRL